MLDWHYKQALRHAPDNYDKVVIVRAKADK